MEVGKFGPYPVFTDTIQTGCMCEISMKNYQYRMVELNEEKVCIHNLDWEYRCPACEFETATLMSTREGMT